MRCAVEIAPIRAAPEEGAEQVTQALLHEPLTVEEQHDGWARILTAYGYGGWVKLGFIEDGEAELLVTRVSPLEVARSFLGASYEWGGLTDRGIDCSGLVHIAYRRSGRLVPRDAFQQEAAGSQIAPGEERPGDLITYGRRSRADHIAFWLGEGRVLHATARKGLGVVAEDEPEELQAQRRFIVRLLEEVVDRAVEAPLGAGGVFAAEEELSGVLGGGHLSEHGLDDRLAAGCRRARPFLVLSLRAISCFGVASFGIGPRGAGAGGSLC